MPDILSRTDTGLDPIVPAPEAYGFPLLLKQLLLTPLARRSPGEIVHGDRRYFYPEMVSRVRRLANVLTSVGLHGGETVAVLDWDSHRYLECYFGIPCTGAVLQTVNIRLSPEQILYTMNHAEAKIVLFHVDFLPLIETIRKDLLHVSQFILIDDAQRAPPAAPFPVAGEYEALIDAASGEYEFPEFDENVRATIFYTSGTTGRPKGVFYSHRQMVLQVLGVLATFGTSPAQGRIHADDVYMPITPMFHAHAWGIPFAATLLGIKQVYPGRYTPERLIRLIRDEGVTFSHCVTTLLQMVLDHPDSADLDFSGMKILVGGGALPKGLALRAMRRGIDVFTGYGMSETGPVVVINHLTTAETLAGEEEQVELRTRAGRPIVLSDVRIADEEMRFQPADGHMIGEVVMRAPWLTPGYWHDDEASDALWRGGWLHSNDVGMIDEAGALKITDRAKDLIKTGGEWLSSLELESLISRCPGVGEVAVIATADAHWGERPLALIVKALDDATPVDAGCVRRHLTTFVEAGQIPKYGVPETILFVAALERTSVGKLDKKALRARYA